MSPLACEDAGPRVSVIIAAYDGEAFVKRAIASALDQALVEVEVIVVDDASSDGTATLVAKLCQTDRRVNLIRLAQNGGPAKARNIGLDAATGDWAAVLDADDAFLPGRLATLVALGNRTQADIVADGFFYYDFSGGQILRPALNAEPAEQILDLPAFVGGARPYGAEADFGLLKPVLRLAFLREHRLRYPEDVRHGEDFAFIFQALAGGARYVLDRRPHYLYSTRSSGTSRTRIDYADQIRRSLALARLPEMRGDRRIVALLRARAAALRRLAMQRRVDLFRRERDYLHLAALLIGRPEGWRWLARYAWRRAVRTGPHAVRP